MTGWSFLTNHARALVFLSDDPDARLTDLAARLGVTERTAFGLVTDLTEAGYAEKERTGRRNRYHIQPNMPLHDETGRDLTVGELLRILRNDA